MSHKVGPWTVRKRHIAYQNPWIEIDHHDIIRPDGAESLYGVVRFKNLAVGVLPLFEDGTVPLVGQHRFPFDAYSWELPEGGGPKGEAPEETARRELAEETGLRAGHIHPLGKCHLSNSVTDEQAVMFLVWDLTQGQAQPEGDEILTHRRVPFKTLFQEVLRGDITDSLTIMMVQMAVLKAQNGDIPPAPATLILKQMG
ncbi:MAG: NUDIX hydrolase [Pseudomonadota bacterium]